MEETTNASPRPRVNSASSHFVQKTLRNPNSPSSAVRGPWKPSAARLAARTPASEARPIYEHFAKTLEILGVPAGEQKLVVWQEKKGYVTEGKAAGMPVMVQAGAVTDVGEVKMSLP